LLSPSGIRIIRFLVGTGGLAAGIVLLATGVGNKAVMVTLVAWGAFTLAFLAIDLSWARLMSEVTSPPADRMSSNPTPGPVEEPTNVNDSHRRRVADSTPDQSQQTAALREGAGTVIQTSGVVLGLVAGLATTVTPALKVGSLSLAAAILVALILYGYVLAPLPELSGSTVRIHVLIRYLFNAALLALALGLVSVAMSITFTR
jgi:hypothetical protein